MVEIPGFAVLMSGMLDDEGLVCRQSVDCRDMDGTSCYCSPESVAALRSRLAGVPLDLPHWIDTGDYHYLSALFMERVKEPFGLLLFDHHPDTQPLAFEEPGMLSCGSWVEWCRRNLPMMREVISVGPPDSPAPAAGSDSDLPLYVSVDLDVLDDREFRSDWDQGDMSLEELVSSICGIVGRRRVLGLDICGGITVSKGGSAEDFRINSSVRERLVTALF